MSEFSLYFERICQQKFDEGNIINWTRSSESLLLQKVEADLARKAQAGTGKTNTGAAEALVTSSKKEVNKVLGTNPNLVQSPRDEHKGTTCRMLRQSKKTLQMVEGT